MDVLSRRGDDSDCFLGVGYGFGLPPRAIAEILCGFHHLYPLGPHPVADVLLVCFGFRPWDMADPGADGIIVNGMVCFGLESGTIHRGRGGNLPGAGVNRFPVESVLSVRIAFHFTVGLVDSSNAVAA